MFRVLISMSIFAVIVLLPGHPYGAQEKLNGWQNTRWGMSLEEVLQALGDKAKIPRAPRQAKSSDEAAYIPSYKVSGCDFRVSFHLHKTTKKLLFVMLKLKRKQAASNCHHQIRLLLIEKYGQPIFEDKDKRSKKIISVSTGEWQVDTTKISLIAAFVKTSKIALDVVVLSYRQMLKSDLDKL